MAKSARYRWQNERKRGIGFGSKTKRRKPADQRGPSGEQTHLIKELRKELGKPPSAMPRTASEASALISRLLEIKRRQPRPKNSRARRRNRREGTTKQPSGQLRT